MTPDDLLSRYTIEVIGPAGPEDLLLRTSDDWERDIPATVVSDAGTRRVFRPASTAPFLYFKAIRRGAGGAVWAGGENRLALPGETTVNYPWFEPDASCSFCALRRLDPNDGTAGHRYRIYYPPGYSENPLARYPVVYMHDGQNIFLAEEAFAGTTWETSRTLETLSAMNAVEPALVVGIFPEDRNREYTQEGWGEYARFLLRHLKPEIDRGFRTRPEPRHTSVMGSSLGGVISFHLGWRHPDVFGQAASLSGTFGYADDLLHRVGSEARPSTRFYLDSGWPHDNYEVTRLMRDRLLAVGYAEGSELLYLTFPEAAHNEHSWALRSHIPLQFLLRPTAPPLNGCRPSSNPRQSPRVPARRA